MPDTAASRPLRVDARRNYDRILAAAEDAFTQHGADASLEAIARQAGVGSATLHRHFPSRRMLLEAVFRDRVDALCAKARALADEGEPGPALTAWLRALNSYAVTSRGLAAALRRSSDDTDMLEGHDSCVAMITAAGDELLQRAQASGAVRPGVDIGDVLDLVTAISLTTEDTADVDRAERLLTIAVEGILP